MKMTEQMLTLVSMLPLPDRDIAIELIEKRDFDTLQELVSSAIIRTEKNLNSDSPKEVYLNANITGMNSLLSIIDSYLLIEEEALGIQEGESWEEEELIEEEEE